MFLVFAIFLVSLGAQLIENNAFLSRLSYMDYFIYSGGTVIIFYMQYFMLFCIIRESSCIILMDSCII
jgi:hypothetical protein